MKTSRSHLAAALLLGSLAPAAPPTTAPRKPGRLAPSNPRPSESSLPPARLGEKRAPEKTPDDLARIEAAEAKRRRRAARRT